MLELAAEAAGLQHPDGWDWITNHLGHKWNPLEDDGDALRLANKLWLEIRHFHGEVHVGIKGEFWCTEHWFPDRDQDLATRKAIVRAAVRIAQLIQQATKG
jgi:hypothetical protein